MHRVFIATTVASSAFIVGKFSAITAEHFLEKSMPTKKVQSVSTSHFKAISLSDFRDIEKIDLFKTKPEEIVTTPKASSKPQKIICDTAEKKSGLPIKLLSTITLQDSVKSIASVQIRSAKDFVSLRQGDNITNLAEIFHINPTKIIIKNLQSGECEYVESKDAKDNKLKPKFKVHDDQSGKKILAKQEMDGIESDGNKFTIKKSLRDEMLSQDNFSKILTQAKAIPIKNPDGSLSFKVTNIVPGSIYSYLNLQDDDVITGMNGEKFQSMNDIMTKFKDFKNIDQLQLSIRRNGSDEIFDFNFK